MRFKQHTAMSDSSPAEAQFQVDAEDVILLILEANERKLNKSIFRGITRLEKLIFLLERETDFSGVGDLFAFRAYNYGPFSKEVYSAIDFLSGYELIEVTEIPHYSASTGAEEAILNREISGNDYNNDADSSQVKEKAFALTSNGRRLANALRSGLASERQRDPHCIDQILTKYGTMPLNLLIKYVYKQYPEMTTKSIHPEAANY